MACADLPLLTSDRSKVVAPWPLLTSCVSLLSENFFEFCSFSLMPLLEVSLVFLQCLSPGKAELGEEITGVGQQLGREALCDSWVADAPFRIQRLLLDFFLPLGYLVDFLFLFVLVWVWGRHPAELEMGSYSQ